jgi:hypothetical protein
MDLLDPLEVDDRNDADLKIAMLGEIDLVGDHASMQPLVEKHVAVAELFPVGEGARLRDVALRFLVVMDIVAGLACALAPVFLEDAFQDLEFVRFRVEMCEIAASILFRGDLRLHRFTVVAVKGVAFDE